MARARRQQRRPVAEGVQTPPPKATLEVCPMCGVSRSAALPDLGWHLQSHRPAEPCRKCTEHTGWTLDWDGVQYPRPDVSLFYCSNCGRYAPVRPREEVS
jgi:hypothetical protein